MNAPHFVNFSHYIRDLIREKWLFVTYGFVSIIIDVDDDDILTLLFYKEKVFLCAYHKYKYYEVFHEN